MAVKVRPYKRRGVVQRGRWQVDVTVKLATGGDAYREQFASRDFQTKAKARAWGEQREVAAKQLAAAGKDVRAIFLALRGQGDAERAQVPTFAEYETPFMIYSRIHNKPSTVFAKEWMLRIHLVPFFGEMRLDEIGPAEIETYKAEKLDEGQNRKSINNHLAALRKLLNLAAEWDVIVKAPKVKAFSLAKNDRIERRRVPHLRGGRALPPGRRARVAYVPRGRSEDRPPRRRAPGAQVGGRRPRRRPARRPSDAVARPGGPAEGRPEPDGAPL